ncbi:MAG: hypothetical protein FWC23_04980 [Chitinispirillia bacterium]|nr:hypothetical protein [Chitinispirillia bacterium]MCL2268521.1 hypothetical protein [Chitinispirillia bacterium]
MFKKVVSSCFAAVMAGVFMVSCVGLDGNAYVRFTWEAVENSNITHISASVADMNWWYDEIYADLANSDEDFTDIPRYNGNPGVKGKIFNFGSSYHPGKGTYFETEAGWFTAVCGVEDQFGLAEIVANYRITINEGDFDGDGADKWFEIAFDVAAFLDGDDDLGWFDYEYDRSNTPQKLVKMRKAGTTQIVKKGGTVDVEYYVIRRPKK